MKNNLINYAYALFSIAKNNIDRQNTFFENIKLVDDVFSSKEIQQFIKENFFNKKMIKKFLKEIYTALKIDHYVIYWLWVIIDNNDLNYLRKICQTSKEYYFSINNIVSIDVFSSFILTKRDITLIDLFFKELLKRKIILNIHYDPNLLCGIKIKFLNKTYDNSVKAKLDILKNKLLSSDNEYE